MKCRLDFSTFVILIVSLLIPKVACAVDLTKVETFVGKALDSYVFRSTGNVLVFTRSPELDDLNYHESHGCTQFRLFDENGVLIKTWENCQAHSYLKTNQDVFIDMDHDGTLTAYGPNAQVLWRSSQFLGFSLGYVPKNYSAPAVFLFKRNNQKDCVAITLDPTTGGLVGNEIFPHQNNYFDSCPRIASNGLIAIYQKKTATKPPRVVLNDYTFKQRREIDSPKFTGTNIEVVAEPLPNGGFTLSSNSVKSVNFICYLQFYDRDGRLLKTHFKEERNQVQYFLSSTYAEKFAILRVEDTYDPQWRTYIRNHILLDLNGSPAQSAPERYQNYDFQSDGTLLLFSLNRVSTLTQNGNLKEKIRFESETFPFLRRFEELGNGRYLITGYGNDMTSIAVINSDGTLLDLLGRTKRPLQIIKKTATHTIFLASNFIAELDAFQGSPVCLPTQIFSGVIFSNNRSLLHTASGILLINPEDASVNRLPFENTLSLISLPNDKLLRTDRQGSIDKINSLGDVEWSYPAEVPFDERSPSILDANTLFLSGLRAEMSLSGQLLRKYTIPQDDRYSVYSASLISSSTISIIRRREAASKPNDVYFYNRKTGELQRSLTDFKRVEFVLPIDGNLVLVGDYQNSNVTLYNLENGKETKFKLDFVKDGFRTSDGRVIFLCSKAGKLCTFSAGKVQVFKNLNTAVVNIFYIPPSSKLSEQIWVMFANGYMRKLNAAGDAISVDIDVSNQRPIVGASIKHFGELANITTVTSSQRISSLILFGDKVVERFWPVVAFSRDSRAWRRHHNGCSTVVDFKKD